MGGSYELVQKLWERFVLPTSWINVTVAWSRDEVLVTSVLFPDCRAQSLILIRITFYFPVLVHSSEWDASSLSNNGMRAHWQFGVKSEIHGSSTWVIKRTWNSTEFLMVAVANIDRYYGDLSSELTILGKFLCAIGSGASLISVSGGSHNLVDCYKEYLGSGYAKTLMEYTTIDVRLFERCLQKTASVAVTFETLDPLSMTEFSVTRLKGAEHRDWKQSRQSLRMTIDTGDFSLTGLKIVVSIIIGEWPLIVSNLKETAKKDSGISLAVGFLLFVIFLI